VQVVIGQAQVAVTPGTVERVRLVPAAPPGCPESVAAIRSADWVVLGPGSWFTSVMTHLLVPRGPRGARGDPGPPSADPQPRPGSGETAGFSAERHLETFAELAPNLHLDVVLADPAVVDDPELLEAACARLGATLFVAPVGRRDRAGEHDPLRFAAAVRDIVTTPRPAR
jgi:uncharacterized cofD-like protein